MAKSASKPLNILLLGKTGHGKSATGNTILQKEVFVTEAGGESVTKDCQLSGNKVGGRQIYILDTPGSMDTDNPENAMKILATAIVRLQNCIDAFLIVINYNTRMTREEMSCFDKLEKLFGREIMDFVVVVFTHGDNYEKHKKKKQDERRFDEFVKENGGEFLTKMLEKCQNRYTLVDNLADDAVIERESSKIMDVVDDMLQKNKGKRYRSPFLNNPNSMVIEKIDANLPKDLTLEEIAIAKQKEMDKYDQEIPIALDEEPNICDEDIAKNDYIQPLMPGNISPKVVELGIEGVYAIMQSSGAHCFPASALVNVPLRGYTKLKDLKVGDKIVTIDANLQQHETEVYLFGHALEICAVSFLNLKTRNCLLKATGDHFIFTKPAETLFTKAARDVTVGDVLVTVDEEGHCVPEEVMEIWQSEEIGLYAPFTMSGSTVVDGVLASCYVDVVPHAVAHSLLWPVRQLYKMSPATLNVVSKPGEDGIPRWMRWCLDNVLHYH